MTGGWIAAVLVVLALATPARALTVDELPPEGVYTIAAIEIDGARGVSRSAMRDVMLSRLPPWYQPWQRWLHPVIFNAGLFRADLVRVEALLRESGFYRAHVRHDLRLAGDRLTIALTIDEGDAVRVASLDVEPIDFAPTPAESAELNAQLGLVRDAIFTQAAYDAGRDRMEALLQRRGFAYAVVEKSAIVDPASGAATVRYRVARGIPARFGEVTVSGTKQVAEYLVRREITFRAGDAFDPRKLDETQARVFGLRLFGSVTVRPSNLADQSGTVDVAIAVVEGPPRELVAGLGYGLEDELRGQLRWQHNDFLGGGRQLGIRIKASGIEQAAEGEFRQPYFLGLQQTLVAPLTQTHEDEPGFMLARVRFAPRIERRLTPTLRVALGYNVEYDDLSNVPNATVERFEGGRAAYRGHGVVSSLTGSLERNTTVDLLDPRVGSVVTLQAEQAGGPWGGNYSFFTTAFDAKRYLPLPAERTLAGRLHMGIGDGFGQSEDLPLFRRFFAGGINSTRGYDRYLVGPLSDNGDPVGGRSLLEASVELRTPLYGPLGGVVFFDAGEVRRKFASYSLDDLQFGAGIGFRYRTIVGPLRLDLGIPLEPPPGQPSWHVHFSIGQAF